jgi:hypothetical protein
MKPQKTYSIADFTIYEYCELESTNQTAKNLLFNQQIHSKQKVEEYVYFIRQFSGISKIAVRTDATIPVCVYLRL